jgi:CubicO group peptidase (beta-lactamase class C family)
MMIVRMSTLSAALRSVSIAALLGLLAVGAVQAQDAPLSNRLDGFDAQIEQVMNDWGVPGLAIGIVTDSSVVWSKGFGDRNVKASTPVTDETLFAVGSATKAFTAAGLGILHDAGELDWSTPVQKHLPRFQLQNRFATQEMTSIDLLTHRSGLPGHNLQWYANDFSRKELFRRLRHLKPSEPFRSTFQYSNQMYMTAGYLAGQISGSTWETFTRRRLLEPLGMSRSTFSVDSMQQTDDYARPYGGGADTTVAIDYRPLDGIGPAGSINASVSEMTEWIQLFLNDGRHGDTQIIDSTTVAQLTRPRIGLKEIRPFMPEGHGSLLYALGWFVETYNGHRLVWHGGDIDGFAAMVAMLPDQDVGWVILTNKTNVTPYIVLYELVDRIVGRDGPDWRQQIASFGGQRQASSDTTQNEETTSQMSPSTGSPSHLVADYAGRYTHPGYGVFEVTIEGDSLAARYGTFDGTLQHEHYDVFELPITVAAQETTLKLRFQTSMDGSIDKVVIPLEPAVEPIVFTRAAKKKFARAEYLKQFTGEYAFRGRTITVALRGEDTLTMAVPGQPTYELEPTSEHAFTLKDQPVDVEFKMDGGEAVQMKLEQPNGTFTAKKK